MDQLDELLISCLFPRTTVRVQKIPSSWYTRFSPGFLMGLCFHSIVSVMKYLFAACLVIMLLKLLKKSFTVAVKKQKMRNIVNNNAQVNIVSSVKNLYKDTLLQTPCSLWFSKLSLQKQLWLPGSSIKQNKRVIPNSQIKDRKGHTKADQCEANQCEANQCEADQCEANQCEADQCEANQCEANQCEANQCEANQCEANQCEANQCEANQCEANQTKSKKPKPDKDDETKSDKQSNICAEVDEKCNKSTGSASSEEVSKFVSLRSEWTANKKAVRSIFTKGSIKRQGSFKKTRRLRDPKRKASLAKMKGSKNAKIVWGDTGPVEIDQFEGEMCVYPKNIGSNATYSKNAYTPFDESSQFGQTNNFVAAFCEPNAMFVQLSAFGQKIFTNKMAGDNYPLEIILTKPTTMPTTKQASAVDVDEATSDLMMGDMKIIRNKYMDNTFLLTSGSPHQRNLESLPRVHVNKEQDIPVSKSTFETVCEEERQEQKLLIETHCKEQHTENTKDDIQHQQHTEETEGVGRLGEQADTQGKTIIDHSKHSERRQQDNSEKENTGQTVTAKSLNRHSDGKNNTSKSKTSEVVQENIAFQFSLSVTKPDVSRGRSTPLQTNSITFKNTDKRSLLQIDISNSDFKNRIGENNLKRPERNFSDLPDHKIGMKNVFSQQDQNVLWTLKEVNELVNSDLDGISRNSKSLKNSSLDNHLNSDKNTSERHKITRNELNENVDSPLVSSCRYTCTSSITNSSPVYSSDTEVSVRRNITGYDDMVKSNSHEDTNPYSKASEEEEDCEIKRITSDMLEGKPPVGKSKALQERDLSMKSEIGFTDTHGDTKVKISSKKNVNDSVSFSDSTVSEKTCSDKIELRTYETLPDECLDVTEPSFVTSPSSSTVTRSMKERSYQSIFGGKLPRRIITKDNILKVKYTEEDRHKLNQKRNLTPKAVIEMKKAGRSVNVYRPKTLARAVGSRIREESPGTTTEDVINCLMNSAERLNQIYTSSSVRKQMFEGAIRNKINNPKYRPYTIPTSHESIERQRSVFGKKSRRLNEEESQLKRDQTSRYPVKNTILPPKEKSSEDEKRKNSASKPSYGNKYKSPKIDFKFQPKRHAPMSPVAPKKVLRPDSSRLLYQRPMMSKNNVPATTSRESETKRTDYRLIQKGSSNEQRKNMNITINDRNSAQRFRQLRQKLPGAAPIRILHSKSKSQILSDNVPQRQILDDNKPQRQILGDNKPQRQIMGDNKPQRQIMGDSKPQRHILSDNEHQSQILSDNMQQKQILSDNKPQKQIFSDNKPQKQILSDNVHQRFQTSERNPVVQWVIGNQETTKNICMIESLHTESLDSNQDERNNVRQEEGSVVSTPLPTQIELSKTRKAEENNKQNDRVPTPDKSDADPRYVNEDSIASKTEKSLNDITFESTILTPVKNSRLPTGFNELADPRLEERLQNLQHSHQRKINFLNQLQDKNALVPEFSQRKRRAVSPKLMPRLESHRRVTLKTKTNENVGLNAIWSPNVNVSPMISPVGLKQSSSTLSKFMEKCILPSLEEISEQRLAFSPSPPSVHPEEEKNLTSSSPVHILNECKTTEIKKPSRKRSSRIPRYVPLVKSKQKEASTIRQDIISSNTHFNFWKIGDTIADAEDKLSTKGSNVLRSSVNQSKPRSPKNRMPSLRSPRQATLTNHETGLKSMLPMLMNRVQDSIIIITPEKKVKHLNLIMNKGNNINDSIISDSKSNVVDDKLPRIGNNNVESIEYHRNAGKESFPDQCNLTIVGAESDKIDGAFAREAHLYQETNNEEMKVMNLKKDEVLRENDTGELHVIDDTSVWVNNRLRNICCPKSCRLCGTSNDVTCDMGKLDMMTSHQQYTMKVEEQIFTHQKLIIPPKVKEEMDDTTESAVHEPLCHVSSMNNNPVNLLTNSLNNDGVNQISHVCKTQLMKPKRSVISFGVKPQNHTRKSGLPRFNKLVTNPAKKEETDNKEEGMIMSKTIPEEKNVITCPVKILTCEDYRIRSRESDSPPVEPFTKTQIHPNVRTVNKPFLNQIILKHKAADEINTNVPRSDIAIRRKISKVRVNKWEKTPTDVNEHSNGGKASHKSAHKRKPLSRGQVVKKKFTIKLDTAKPTASYPVCGSIETQSLNDEACTYKSNASKENRLVSRKSKINITPKINSTEHVPYYEAKKRSSSNFLNKQSPTIQASNSKDSATGQKKYSIQLPTKKWRTEMPQKIARQKVNLKILDQLLQETKQSVDKQKPAPPHRMGKQSTHAGSIDKKTDNLLKGKASEVPHQLQVKQTRTSLQRKQSTHQHHDMISGDQPVSSKSSKKITISSEDNKVRRLGGPVAASGKEKNLDHGLKKPQKIHIKHDTQRPVFFSEHSPVKVLNQKEKSEKTAKTSSQSSDITKGHLKKSKVNQARGNDGVNEKGNGIIQEKDLYLDRKKYLDNAADSSYEHAFSRDLDVSTTMPTTEADMRVNTSKDRKKRDHGKHDRAISSQTQEHDIEEELVGRDDILCSENIQTLLRNFRSEEQEMLVTRLKSWIKNRLTQTENESETSTEAIVCKEIEYVLKNIINSLDTGTVKSIFHNIQPKLEHLDRILEVDEKSAELADSNKSIHRKLEEEQGEKLRSRENESHMKKSDEHASETNKCIYSPSQCLSKFNLKNIKESTKYSTQGVKSDVEDSREKRPISSSRLPKRNSSPLNRRGHPDVSENLYHTLMKIKQQNIHHNILYGTSPAVVNGRDATKEGEDIQAKCKEMAESDAVVDNKDENLFFHENNESHNQRLPSTHSPSPFADLTNMYSNDLYSYQQASDLSSDLLKRMYSDDAVFLYKRFPSVSSASCFDVGATYVASTKSPQPIQKASYVISKRIGHFDESLRSLPEDLLLGSSTYSGPWSPISRGRFSDYRQGFDFGQSLSFESRTGSRRSDRESRLNNDKNVRDDRDSNSSAEVILSWLARSPDIDVSVERTVKRENSSYITKADATHTSQKLPLPTSSVEDEEVITDEKSSPWLANLKQKSFSPLNLKDLDSSLDYPVSQRATVQSRTNECGTKTDIITWPLEKHFKLSGQHKKLSEIRTSVAKKEKRKFERTNANEDHAVQRVSERDHSKITSDQNEMSPTKSGNESCRKEQNESFNNRLGRNMASYSQRTKHEDDNSFSRISSGTQLIDFSELESGNNANFGAISNMQFNISLEAERVESCSFGNSFDTNLCLDSPGSASEWPLNVYSRASQRHLKRKEEFPRVCETAGRELTGNVTFHHFTVTPTHFECTDIDKDGEISSCKMSNHHLSPAFSPHYGAHQSADSDGQSLANQVMNDEWGAPDAAALSQVSFDWYKPNVNSGRLQGDTTRDSVEGGRGDDDGNYNSDNNLEDVQEGDAMHKEKATVVNTQPCLVMGTSEYTSSRHVALHEKQTSEIQIQHTSKRKTESLEATLCDFDAKEQWDKIHGDMNFDHMFQETYDFRSPHLQDKRILKTDKNEFYCARLHEDMEQDDIKIIQGEGSNQKQRNVSLCATSMNNDNQIMNQQIQAPSLDYHFAVGHLKSSLNKDASAYPQLKSTGRCVSFISARERNRNSNVSLSNSRSQSEQFKVARTSSSGYSYKLPNRTDNEMFYQNHISSMGENVSFSLSGLNGPSCINHVSSHLSTGADASPYCDGLDSHMTTRPNYSHRNGFSYLYTDSFDSGAGTGDTLHARTISRPVVVRTRRPRKNTMVGQIVKMFEKRLQFRPIQN